jgi:hypothetical protein
MVGVLVDEKLLHGLAHEQSFVGSAWLPWTAMGEVRWQETPQMDWTIGEVLGTDSSYTAFFANERAIWEVVYQLIRQSIRGASSTLLYPAAPGHAPFGLVAFQSAVFGPSPLDPCSAGVTLS